ncbi:hypothetical protein BDV18DRAFT_158354 [Aspergillus unguis]
MDERIHCPKCAITFSHRESHVYTRLSLSLTEQSPRWSAISGRNATSLIRRLSGEQCAADETRCNLKRPGCSRCALRQIPCVYPSLEVPEDEDETLWIKEMIGSYEDRARESGAILIPGISPTAPADLLAWLIARESRELFSTGAEQIIASGKLDINAMSPGSVATVLDSLETLGSRVPVLAKILGYRSVPILGPLTTSITGPGNASVVHRSASQNPGPLWPAVSRTRSIYLLRGIFSATVVDSRMPVPVQEELRRYERAEYHAVGYIHGRNHGQDTPAIQATFLRKGALYEFTAMLTCVGARVLLSRLDNKNRVQRREGGFFTPSFLGMDYVDALREAGAEIVVELVK